MARRPANGMERESLWRQDIERRLRAVESNAPGGFSGDGETTFLRDGRNLEIVGGQLRAVSGTTVRTILDHERLRFNRADGTRILEITPSGGMILYAANGSTQLASLDSDGLKIGGVLQPEIKIASDTDASSNVSLGTSFTSVAQVIIPIPSFAATVDLLSIVRTQITNLSGSGYDLVTDVTNDVGGAGEHTNGSQMRIPDGENQSLVAHLSTSLSSPGSTVTVRQRARVTAGSNAANQNRLSVIAIAHRT